MLTVAIVRRAPPWSWWHSAWLLAILPILAGCSREEIRAYQAAKESRPPPAPAGAATMAEASREHLHWDLPAGWEEQSATGVRAANFAIRGPQDQRAEVAILPFGQMGGGDLEFVNLWRSTLGLTPVDATQLGAMVSPIGIGDGTGKLFDVMQPAAGDATPAKAHMLVASIVRQQTTWFFKLAGDAALVAEQTPAFKSFLKSITFHGSDDHTGQGSPGAQEPAPAVASPVRAPTPDWTVPAHWKSAAPSAMLLAKFTLPGENNLKAEVTVSCLNGDGGGLLANVNRWRGQIGLTPLQETELAGVVTPLEAGPDKAVLVDMTGTLQETGKPARLMAAVFPRDGQTWFYKLLGDAAVAEKEREEFLKFIQSARQPNA